MHETRGLVLHETRGLVWTHFCDDDYFFFGQGKGKKKKDSWRMHMTMHETRGLVWTHLCVAIIFFFGSREKGKKDSWRTHDARDTGARLNALLWWWLFFFWAGEGEKKKRSVTHAYDDARDTGARSAWDTGARLNALVCVVIIIIFFLGRGQGEGKKRFVTHAWCTRHGGSFCVRHGGSFERTCVRWWRDYLFFGGAGRREKKIRDARMMHVVHGARSAWDTGSVLNALVCGDYFFVKKT